MADTDDLTAEQKEVLQTLQQPVQDGDVNEAHIGMFSRQNANKLNDITHIYPEADVDDWRQSLSRPTRTITADNLEDANKEAAKNYDNLAYHQAGAIVLPKYELTENVETALKDAKYQFNQNSQYILQNPLVEIDVLAHERTHSLHYQQHSGANDTPYMAAQSTDMTEQIANFNEYMTYAHMWKNAKQSGAQTITIKDQTIKTDDILNYLPGLKEEVLKNGFDEKDPACRERIAKISSEYWNTERADAIYAKQARTAALNTVGMAPQQEENASYSLAGAIVNAREWEERKKLMVQNLQTGDGVTYSAPECLKYFVPSEERTQKIIDGITNVSNQDLLKIDAYLDKKGLTNDSEKELYIAQQMVYIPMRDPKADKEFADLLISVSPPDKQDILYADGISVKHDKGTNTVTKDDVTFSISTTAEKEVLAAQLKQQSLDGGTYPPVALTPQDAANRTAADVKMTRSCAQREQQKAKEQKTETQTTLKTENIAALKNYSNQM